MNYKKLNTCKECLHADYLGCGKYLCKATKMLVIVSDVPSEYHFECLKVYGKIPDTLPNSVGQYTKSGQLIKVHNSVRDAAEYLGIQKNEIYACLTGRKQSYKGCKWHYIAK